VARARSIYACTHCGAQQPRWLGRCPECGAWSTLVEEASAGSASAGAPRDLLRVEPGMGGGAKPRQLSEIEASATPRRVTGIRELDRVLGGGLVPGSVVLLGGEPGVGKSTLALQLAAGLQSLGPFLYVENDRDEMSKELIQWLLSAGYRLYWHLPPLFSADNFFANPENVFGSLISANMLAVPASSTIEVTRMRQITSPDDSWRSR
jgi:hypothetical protein